MVKFLQIDEVLNSILEKYGLQKREEQIRYAQCVYYSLLSGYQNREKGKNITSVALLEAATGTGKTLAYLTAAACFARNFSQKVIISTFTRNLQKQIFNEVDRVIKVIPVRISLLKGMTNYFSRKTLQGFINNCQTLHKTVKADRKKKLLSDLIELLNNIYRTIQDEKVFDVEDFYENYADLVQEFEKNLKEFIHPDISVVNVLPGMEDEILNG